MMADLVHQELQVGPESVEIDTLSDPCILEKQQVEYVVLAPQQNDDMSQTVDALNSPVTREASPTTTIVTTATATATTVVPGTKGPQKQSLRRSFTTEFKLECVQHAEKTKNKTETARLFNVNRRRVQEWCLQKEKLMAIPKQQKRLSGGGRRHGSSDQLSVQPERPSPLVLDSDLPKESHITTVTIPPISEQLPLESEMMTESPISREIPQLPQVPNIDTISPEAIIETIVRGLTSSDASTLPSNMLKVIQDLSSEVMSQDTKAAVESMIRDASIELLLQKSDSPSTTSPIPMLVDVESSQEAGKGLSTEMVAATSELVDREHEACSGVGANSIEKVDPSVRALPLGQSVLDTVQVAILEAFMQVLTSMQGSTSLDLLQSPLKAASTDSSASVGCGEGQQVLTSNTQQQQQEQPLVPTTPHSPKMDTTAGIQVAMEINPEALTENGVMSMTSQVVTNSTDQPLTSLEEPPKNGDSSNDSKPPSSRPNNVVRKGKKCYSVDFKLECVAHAEATSKCAAARKFQVDRRRVQDWCSQKEKLEQLRWMPPPGKRNIDIEVEKRLTQWVKEKQEAGKPLSRRMVGDQAVKLYAESGNTNFTASIGWVAKFMIRNDISLVSSSRSHQKHHQKEAAPLQSELEHLQPELIQPNPPEELQPELAQPHPQLQELMQQPEQLQPELVQPHHQQPELSEQLQPELVEPHSHTELVDPEQLQSEMAQPHPQLQPGPELIHPHPQPELLQPHLQLQPELVQAHPHLESEQANVLVSDNMEATVCVSP